MVYLCFLYSTIAPEVRQFLLDQLSDFSDLEIFFPQSDSDEELLPHIIKADIIIGWKISHSLLSDAENLKLYISPYTGVSYLLKTFKDVGDSLSDVTLVNAHGAAPLIAQHAVALLLTTLNGIPFHHENMKTGKWKPGGEGVGESVPSYDISQRKIGLLGYGHINRIVHNMLTGFVNEISICRNSWKKQRETYPSKIHRFTPDNLEAFFAQIDTLIIAAPLTDRTLGMVKEKHLKLLGSDGILVNVGRGKIVEETALYTTLKSGQIARAAIDVWYNYRPEPDEFGRHYPFSEEFHTLPNIIMSPHRADSPFSDLRRWDDIIENIRRFIAGRKDFLNIVNITEGY